MKKFVLDFKALGAYENTLRSASKDISLNALMIMVNEVLAGDSNSLTRNTLKKLNILVPIEEEVEQLNS